jgi:hypothetical protein
VANMDGHLDCADVNSNSYKTSVRKPEEMRFLGIRRHRWEANVGVGLSNMTRESRVRPSD